MDTEGYEVAFWPANTEDMKELVGADKDDTGYRNLTDEEFVCWMQWRSWWLTDNEEEDDSIPESPPPPKDEWGKVRRHC